MRRKDRQITDIDKLHNILQEAEVCRIAFSDHNIQYIIAMNYGFETSDKTVIYFHTAKEGKKIDLLKKNNYVCFQVDSSHKLTTGKKACNYSMKVKSIVGYGNIFIVDDKEEKIKALNQIMFQYTQEKNWEYSDKMLNAICILKLIVEKMDGKSNY